MGLSLLLAPLDRPGDPPEPKMLVRRREPSYRWALTYAWAVGEPILPWIMLNPSHAGGRALYDLTARRVIRFSWRWGFGGALLLNACPIIAPRTQDLRAWLDGFRGGDIEARDALWHNRRVLRDELAIHDAAMVALGMQPSRMAAPGGLQPRPVPGAGLRRDQRPRGPARRGPAHLLPREDAERSPAASDGAGAPPRAGPRPADPVLGSSGNDPRTRGGGMTRVLTQPRDLIAGFPRLRLTPRQFDDLPDYSASYPTGTTPGKMWRRLDGAFDRAFIRAGGQPYWLVMQYDPAAPSNAEIAAMEARGERLPRIKILRFKPIIVLRAATKRPTAKVRT